MPQMHQKPLFALLRQCHCVYFHSNKSQAGTKFEFKNEVVILLYAELYAHIPNFNLRVINKEKKL